MRLIAGIAIVAAVAAFSDAARAGSYADDLQACHNIKQNQFDLLRKLADACTTVIKTANADKTERGFAYRKRGSVYFLLNDLHNARIRMGGNYPDRSLNDLLKEGDKPGGDFLKRSLGDYSAALKLDPDDAGALSNRGYILFKTGQFDRAEKDLDHLVRLKPDQADPWSLRCQVRAVLNRLQPALADCDKALQMKLAYPEQTEMWRGIIFYKQRKYDAALSSFEAVLRKNPKLNEAVYGRGLAKRRKGDAAGADADIGAVKSTAPGVIELFARWGVR